MNPVSWEIDTTVAERRSGNLRETPRLEIVAPDGWQLGVPEGVHAQTLSCVVAVLRQAPADERV